MARYRGTVLTDRPIEEVFDYLSDFSNVEEWDPGVVEAELLDPDPRREGARFRVVSSFLGRDVPLVYETVRFERPHRIVLRAESSTVISRDTITLESGFADRTLVSYDADLRLKGLARIGELPMRLLFRRVGEQAKAGLKQRLRR
jgi:carbon monoxide dehydrogenase subunit G